MTESEILIEEFDYARHGTLSYAGFFVGWLSKPSDDALLHILTKCHRAYVAVQGGRTIGFVYCISDGLLSCYIPLLEVLPEHQGKGLGKELVRRLIRSLESFYMIDLSCDADVIPFYEKAWPGMKVGAAMFVRNYDALGSL